MSSRAVLTCALFALVGCEPPEEREPAPATWVYPPAVAAWPIGPIGGALGRSQPPQLTEQLGIAGSPTVPLRLPTPWTVPGATARAIVYGLAGDAPAVELIDVDAGTMTWRDTTVCAGPVVGVTEQVVVCADAKGTRAIGLDGKKRWASDAAFFAMTGERVVTGTPGEAVILDATKGTELSRVKLPPAPPIKTPVVAPRGRPVVPSKVVPPPVPAESIIASCGDAGRELFAYGEDGQLLRIADGPTGPKIMWAVPLPTVAGLEACDSDSVLVTTANAAGTELVALARATGAQTGIIDGVRGFWPARDGSPRLEISTNAGIAIYTRDLAGPMEPTTLPVLDELLAKRGDMRLVRATKHTAAVLDARGVRTYLPLAQLGAVLGDKAIVAASWLGSPGETVHRYALPERYRKVLRVPPQRGPLAVPAELRDLPTRVELDVAGAIAKADTGKHSVTAVALDPIEPSWVYAATLEHAPDVKSNAGLARFDLTTRTWSWYRNDGCGSGTPVALAAAREVVVCAARNSSGATVVATTRDGRALWQWHADNVDALAAAADVVIVHDADRLHVLDGRNGKLLATYTSDDGGAMPAAALDVEGMAMVVVAQRGLVMARLPRVQMVPAWTLAVHGLAAKLVPAHDGVLVALDDGDAYRVDARTGAVVAIPGLDLVWGASGDVVTGQAPGGPVPPQAVAAPVVPKAPVKRGPPPPPRDPAEDPPLLPKPWPAPGPLPASWQYTLYELTGALRARNDYALESPITPAARGPGDSPLVVQYGPGLREVLVVEPRRGDPVRRVHLPDDAAPGTAFATLVDGKPVVGTLLVNPLRAVLF